MPYNGTISTNIGNGCAGSTEERVGGQLCQRGLCCMKISWLKAILLFPFNITVIIPTLLLWYTDYQWFIPAPSQIVISIILFGGGLYLFIKTALLFHKEGQGTLSPLEPPKRLIIKGPYKKVRNPILLGILFLLLSEVVFFSSSYIFIYTIIFFFINCIYFKTVEEKKLIKRFGQDYIAYRNSVPMWLPNLHDKSKMK